MKTTPSPLHRNSPHRGFTLIEMMVTVVIIAILSAIALPSYNDYIIRGKLPDAMAGLSAKQLKIEQFFLDNRTYVGAPDCVADTASSKYFDFACSINTAAAYQLDATGKTSTAGFTFTINQSNAKTTSAVPTGWSAASPNNCWVTRKGGVC